MTTSPYRDYYGASFSPSAPTSGPELDLRPALALFWLVSLLRAVYAVIAGQGFGVEATLAVLVVIALPMMLFDRPKREQHAE